MTLALFSLIVSTLVTTTVAWFKVADTLIASNIAIDFVKDEGFDIGLTKDGKTDYYNQVDTTLLTQYYSDFDPTTPFLDVSSMFQDQWLNDKTVFADAKPVLHNNYLVSSNPTVSPVAITGYLQLEFLIHSDKAMTVYLSRDTSLLANTSANEKVAATKGLNADNLNKIQDCLRISLYTEKGFFILEPNVDTPSNTALAGRINTNVAGSPYYDLDSTNHEVLYGDYGPTDSSKPVTLKYDEASRAAVPSEENLSWWNSGTNPAAVDGGLDIAASESEGNLSISHQKTYTLKQLGLEQTSSTTTNGAPALMDLKAGEDKRIVVTVWMEGWDKDMVDGVGSAVFDLNLAFTGLYDYSKGESV
jgi:hypothetical protein